MKCEICRQEYSPDCTWNQGRCPFQMPMIGSSRGLLIGYAVAIIFCTIMLYGFTRVLGFLDVLY